MAKKVKDAYEDVAAPKFEAPETLIGDLVTWVRDEMAALPSVWQSISEEGQRMILDRIAMRAAGVAQQCVNLVATEDMPALSAEVESITFKDGIKCVLQLNRHDANRFLLTDAVGGQVRVVVTPDVESAFGGGVPDAEADQRALELQGAEA